MFSRRQFLLSPLFLASKALMANPHAPSQPWYMPDEAAPHQCTWMAFGAAANVWGKRQLPQVQANLAELARTIAQYEPVKILVRPHEQQLAHNLIGSSNIEFIPTALDDVWIRDTGPVFLLNDAGEKAAIDLNFNGWGNKQAHYNDAQVAAFVAQHAQVPLLSTPLVLEGGCIEVDGEGTAILTESCTLNDNRNPQLSKAEFAAQLMEDLGLEKIIWLPGIKGADITDGHTDFYARFVHAELVLAGYEPDPMLDDHAITIKHLDILRNARNAQGKPLAVQQLTAPTTLRKPHQDNLEFAAGYVGFYVCNGAVIMQEFGDKQADAAAQTQLQQAYPQHEIVALNMDALAAGGGSIHCVTQQEPAV